MLAFYFSVTVTPEVLALCQCDHFLVHPVGAINSRNLYFYICVKFCRK